MREVKEGEEEEDLVECWFLQRRFRVRRGAGAGGALSEEST